MDRLTLLKSLVPENCRLINDLPVLWDFQRRERKSSSTVLFPLPTREKVATPGEHRPYFYIPTPRNTIPVGHSSRPPCVCPAGLRVLSAHSHALHPQNAPTTPIPPLLCPIWREDCREDRWGKKYPAMPAFSIKPHKVLFLVFLFSDTLTRSVATRLISLLTAPPLG